MVGAPPVAGGRVGRPARQKGGGDVASQQTARTVGRQLHSDCIEAASTTSTMHHQVLPFCPHLTISPIPCAAAPNLLARSRRARFHRLLTLEVLDGSERFFRALTQPLSGWQPSSGPCVCSIRVIPARPPGSPVLRRVDPTKRAILDGSKPSSGFILLLLARGLAPRGGVCEATIE
jgi:hypothetical protein